MIWHGEDMRKENEYMNRLIELYLERRGYTRQMLREMNDDRHAELMSISEMCAELKHIHDSHAHIVILPDFDMDGIMSGTVGFAGLSELGFKVSLFRPTPSDGYGFNAETICRLVKEYPDVQAIITCDVGITCYEGVAAASAMGIKMLITDHHVQEDADKLAADVIVNPNRKDETYANKGICGAHVFWQVLQHYADNYCDLFTREQIRRLRVFAGIGTISDAMPLVNENRPLVMDACGICRLVYGDAGKFFLENMRGSNVYRRAFYGLHYALQVFADNGKIQTPDDITEDFFGFYLAPAFNSLKRMNGDMDIAFGVFFGDHPFEDASTLFMLNEQRKLAVAQYFEEMMTTNQPYAPYVYISDAQPGILGLLAMKAMTITGVPTMVMREDDGHFHGSGRAPSWYPAIDMIHPEGFFIAGHQGAFGIGVTDKRECEALWAFLKQSTEEILANMPEEAEGASTADIVICQRGSGDTDIDIPLFLEYLAEIKTLRPFGRAFEAPVIELRFRADDGDWSVMGSAKQHLKIRMAYGFEVLCWNQAAMLDDMKSDDEFVVQGHLGRSEFRGRFTVNMVGDIRKACRDDE